MEMEVEKIVRGECAVHGCETIILPGDTYYMLGGGKVMNCENCACRMPIKIVVNGVDVHMTRSWDKVAIANNLKRIM